MIVLGIAAAGPIGVALTQRADPTRRLLIPLAYASALG